MLNLPPDIQDPRQLLDPPYSYVAYGGDVNCTLSVCPVELSVYQYIPSLAANVCFIIFFGIALVIHLFMGIKYRTWSFVICMAAGCVSELIGYGGRIMLHKNPFVFDGFLIQIILVTFGPVFFTAAIYFTLARVVRYLGEQYARFPAKFYYWIFIPCDILSLVLQAVGGAGSSTSEGDGSWAVNVSLGGLSFQVFTLCIFFALSADFAWKYYKAKDAKIAFATLPRRFKVFATFLTLAFLFILVRCIYRIDELSEGYSGDLIHNEGLFIALEGVMVLVAVYWLIPGHPGPIVPKVNSPQPAAEVEVEEKA